MLEEYLFLHCLTAIPVGIAILDVDLLTIIHQYLYHRLPCPNKLAELNRSIRRVVQNDQKKVGEVTFVHNEPPQLPGFKMERVHCIGTGGSFGEMALQSDGGKRAARLVTVTACHFMTISR